MSRDKVADSCDVRKKSLIITSAQFLKITLIERFAAICIRDEGDGVRVPSPTEFRLVADVR